MTIVLTDLHTNTPSSSQTQLKVSVSFHSNVAAALKHPGISGLIEAACAHTSPHTHTHPIQQHTPHTQLPNNTEGGVNTLSLSPRQLDVLSHFQPGGGSRSAKCERQHIIRRHHPQITAQTLSPRAASPLRVSPQPLTFISTKSVYTVTLVFHANEEDLIRQSDHFHYFFKYLFKHSQLQPFCYSWLTVWTYFFKQKKRNWITAWLDHRVNTHVRRTNVHVSWRRFVDIKL